MLREYLLGTSRPEEQEQVEMRLLLDENFLLEAEMLADELIDDYLDDNLSQGDRKAFETYFLSAPEQQGRLKFVAALKRRASEEDSASSPGVEVRRGLAGPASRLGARLYSFISQLRTQSSA
jgi:hypothetical protein